jgi:hypothetical protein
MPSALADTETDEMIRELYESFEKIKLSPPEALSEPEDYGCD